MRYSMPLRQEILKDNLTDIISYKISFTKLENQNEISGTVDYKVDILYKDQTDLIVEEFSLPFTCILQDLCCLQNLQIESHSVYHKENLLILECTLLFFYDKEKPKQNSMEKIENKIQEDILLKEEVIEEFDTRLEETLTSKELYERSSVPSKKQEHHTIYRIISINNASEIQQIKEKYNISEESMERSIPGKWKDYILIKDYE